MELNSWLRSLHERCPKHWIDSSRKYQDHLQTQGNKIKMNDDYNKNNYEQKHLHVHTVIQSLPESPSPSTSEVETTATSSITSLFQSDSESDQSTDSLLPSIKQPRIEQEPEVSVVNTDVAYLAKTRSSLTEHKSTTSTVTTLLLVLITVST